jgi:hypothetical protein
MFHRDKKRVASKGQFTLFVIVGLVILFAFLFYARARIITAQLVIQADIQIKNYINQNSINQYVTSCLDAVSDDIFIRAAMQGGTINFTGKTRNSDYIEYFDPVYNRWFNVSIVVDGNYRCPDPNVPLTEYIVARP